MHNTPSSVMGRLLAPSVAALTMLTPACVTPDVKSSLDGVQVSTREALAGGLGAMTSESVFDPPIDVKDAEQAENCVDNPTTVRLFDGVMTPSENGVEIKEVTGQRLDVLYQCQQDGQSHSLWASCNRPTAAKSGWGEIEGKPPFDKEVRCETLTICHNGGAPIERTDAKIQRK